MTKGRVCLAYSGQFYLCHRPLPIQSWLTPPRWPGHQHHLALAPGRGLWSRLLLGRCRTNWRLWRGQGQGSEDWCFENGHSGSAPRVCGAAMFPCHPVQCPVWRKIVRTIISSLSHTQYLARLTHVQFAWYVVAHTLSVNGSYTHCLLVFQVPAWLAQSLLAPKWGLLKKKDVSSPIPCIGAWGEAVAAPG